MIYNSLIYAIIPCSDNGTAWRYASTVAPKSSVTILAESLASNQTYQFMVSMIDRQDPSIQGIAYLLVKVQDKDCPMITIGYVFSFGIVFHLTLIAIYLVVSFRTRVYPEIWNIDC